MKSIAAVALVLGACHPAPRAASVVRGVADGGPASLCEIDPSACPAVGRDEAIKRLVGPVSPDKRSLDDP